MLSKDISKMYWASRAATQGARTVGFSNQDMSVQDQRYAQRKDFIFNHCKCPTDLATLDYGCGIGRYADIFDTYTGVDFTDTLLKLAMHTHPDKEFVLLDDVGLPNDFTHPFDMVFTATVLQHNSDAAVVDIFNSIRTVRAKPTLFALYENEKVQSAHVCGRNSAAYRDLLHRVYSSAKILHSNTHIIHGEAHQFSLIEVKV